MTRKPASSNHFKTKFNWLVENFVKPDGGRFTDREIAERIGTTPNYVWRLRNDPNVNNPSLEVVESIARFFNVELNYFDDRAKSETLEQLLQSAFLSKIAKRAPALDELNPETQDALLQIIDHMLGQHVSPPSEAADEESNHQRP
jgi:transcriptional regulator with XRE-family HTH domain